MNHGSSTDLFGDPRTDDGRYAPHDSGTLAVRLEARLSEAQSRWLAGGRELVHDRPDAILDLIPVTGRHVGRVPLNPWSDPADVNAWSVDDAARVLLLSAMGPAVTAYLERLYWHGERTECRGILRALPYLEESQASAAVAADGLRSNDPALVAAAMSPRTLTRLGADALAQAVLKCVFIGVPLKSLAIPVTPELSAMLARYAHERVAAGRDVPEEIWPLIYRHPPAVELSALGAELGHPDPARRDAARRALSTTTDS